jgi:hypothetical protein
MLRFITHSLIFLWWENSFESRTREREFSLLFFCGSEWRAIFLAEHFSQLHTQRYSHTHTHIHTHTHTHAHSHIQTQKHTHTNTNTHTNTHTHTHTHTRMNTKNKINLRTFIILFHLLQLSHQNNILICNKCQ